MGGSWQVKRKHDKAVLMGSTEKAALHLMICQDIHHHDHLRTRTLFYTSALRLKLTVGLESTECPTQSEHQHCL